MRVNVLQAAFDVTDAPASPPQVLRSGVWTATSGEGLCELGEGRLRNQRSSHIRFCDVTGWVASVSQGQNLPPNTMVFTLAPRIPRHGSPMPKRLCSWDSNWAMVQLLFQEEENEERFQEVTFLSKHTRREAVAPVLWPQSHWPLAVAPAL